MERDPKGFVISFSFPLLWIYYVFIENSVQHKSEDIERKMQFLSERSDQT